MELQDVVRRWLGSIAGWILVHPGTKGKPSSLAKSGKNATKHLLTGGEGEDAAAAYLWRKGYRILDRNHRNRGGEIDIVAKEGGTYVFVEVKAQWALRNIPPEARVNREKLWRLRRASQCWLDRHAPESPARIDVVGVAGGRVTAHYEGVEE